MGTMGKASSLRVLSLRAQAGKVVKQIETSCSSDPIMRRPVRRPRREASNLRERKAVVRGSKSRSSLTPTTPIREDSHNVNKHIVKVGVNYLFNWGAPVVARY